MNIEEIIRRAQEEGRFDNLPGKGKPLDLSKRNPQDPVIGIAKEAGYVPEWAALGKEVDASEEEARRVKERWRHQRDAYLKEAESRLRSGREGDARDALRQRTKERDRLAYDLTKRWTRDRRNVERYNLLVPNGHNQRILPSPKRLLEAFLAESPDVALSSDDPPRLLPREAKPDVAGWLAQSEKEIAEERGERPVMNSVRAEALLNFKSRYSGWRKRI